VGGVEAGTAEIGQPLLEFRQEWVRGRTGDFYCEQLPPWPVCVDFRRGESHVELLLPDSGGAAGLGWPGRSLVAVMDLGGGAPYLHIGDQLGRQRSMELGRPGRRFTFGAEADLVGELSHQL
jgi:hypothetical protein